MWWIESESLRFGLFFVLGLCWASFFAEFCLHRYVFHGWLRNRLLWWPAVTEHIRHHRENFWAPFWIKGLIVVPLLFGLSFLFLGNLGFSCGITFYYCALEALHWSFHNTKPATSFGLYLRRWHFYHHFNNAQTNFSFFALFYDWYFATASLAFEKEMIKVPKSYDIEWLHNKEIVFAPYTEYFQLRE